MSLRASVFALLLVLLAPGCARRPEFADVADAGFGRGSREAAALTARALAPAASSAATDSFLSLAGRKPGGQGFVQNTPDVWGPFDVQVHTGFFDEEQIASPDDVRVCLEIDNLGFAIHYDVCAQWSLGAGLWQVFAFTQAGALTGSRNIASNEFELRIEQVDDDLNFYTRAFGSSTWLLVATTTFPAQTEPFKVGFGGVSLSKGTAVGFDDVSVTSGPPGVAPTGGALVAVDVNAALLSAYQAHHALDAGLGDFGTAGGAVEDAQLAVSDAEDGVAGLPPSKETQAAAKLLAKADKSLAKAHDLVVDEQAAKAQKSLEKIAAGLIEAALLLNPQPFSSSLPAPDAAHTLRRFVGAIGFDE